MGIENLSWAHGIGVAVALMLAPAIRYLWKKVEDHDNRKMIAYEEKRARKIAEKAAKEAAKLQSSEPRYTSATVVGPPRLGHDGSGDRTTGEAGKST